MGDADATTAATTDANSARRGRWVWIFLVLWLVWLGAMILMSSSEWGKPKPKPKHLPDEPPISPGRGVPVTSSRGVLE